MKNLGSIDVILSIMFIKKYDNIILTHVERLLKKLGSLSGNYKFLEEG